MRIESRRTGFALPMAILLIGFMTAGLVAAFTRIEAESRVSLPREGRTVVATAGHVNLVSVGLEPGRDPLQMPVRTAAVAQAVGEVQDAHLASIVDVV